jgi:signal recognition particle subunit SRP68
LVETLDHYPTGGEVNLSNLVSYPTKLEAVPVKPLFFDVAWNYIEYPGRSPQPAAQVPLEEIPSSKGEEKQETKKGWFGFGRS